MKKKMGTNDTPFQQLLLQENSPFSMKEAYYALRTKVLFSLPGAGCKVLGITSACMHEGKSSNAINTAISFAELGKRVLIFDGDMRLPTVASKLGLKGIPGLSDCLVGMSEVTACIRPSGIGNFDVLPSGNIPPNPTALLQSEEMDMIVRALRTKYDFIIIDLPPVNTVADPLILTRMVDGYLVVIRHNQTEFKEIDRAVREMKRVNAAVIGFVYNSVPNEKKSYYYKKYGK